MVVVAMIVAMRASVLQFMFVVLEHFLILRFGCVLVEFRVVLFGCATI